MRQGAKPEGDSVCVLSGTAGVFTLPADVVSFQSRGCGCRTLRFADGHAEAILCPEHADPASGWTLPHPEPFTFKGTWAKVPRSPAGSVPGLDGIHPEEWRRRQRATSSTPAQRCSEQA